MHTSSADHTSSSFGLCNAIAKQALRARASILAPRASARLNVSILASGCATGLADAPLLALAHDLLPVKHYPSERAELGRSLSYSWAETPDLWEEECSQNSFSVSISGLQACRTTFAKPGWMPPPRIHVAPQQWTRNRQLTTAHKEKATSNVITGPCPFTGHISIR